MRLLKHPLYQKELRAISSLPFPWEKLRGKRIVISGATGMIGHFLVDVLLSQNLGCQVLALGRSEDKAHACFEEYWDNPSFQFVPWDFRKALTLEADFVLHLASTTHPKAYATQPIDTVLLNVQGLGNLLEAASKTTVTRFLFASSCEVYGEPPEGMNSFAETDCGYINCNTLRAGYPESKRAGEALCQAYHSQKGLDVVIPRFSRIYGATMLPTDSKALSQFLKNALESRQIVLKSEGKQVYSYTHVADAVSGLLCCLLMGKVGEAYNVAGKPSSLWELAQIAANWAGTQVVFQLPESVEKSGYSVVKRSVLDTAKLEFLGWKPLFPIQEGIRETLQILHDQKESGA